MLCGLGLLLFQYVGLMSAWHRPNAYDSRREFAGSFRDCCVGPFGLLMHVSVDMNDIIPERLPIILLCPHVRPLKERHRKPLRLHEDPLRRSYFSFHGEALSIMCQVEDVIPNPN